MSWKPVGLIPIPLYLIKLTWFFVLKRVWNLLGWSPFPFIWVSDQFDLIFCSQNSWKPVGLMLLGSSVALNCDFHARVAEGGSHLCQHLILPSFRLIAFFRFYPVYHDIFSRFSHFCQSWHFQLQICQQASGGEVGDQQGQRGGGGGGVTWQSF